MFRAYQSPCSGTHCGLQCAQIPNFASRNQFGQRYAFRDSQNGRNGPSGIFPRKNAESAKDFGIPANAKAQAAPCSSDRRFKGLYLHQIKSFSRAAAELLCSPKRWPGTSISHEREDFSPRPAKHQRTFQSEFRKVSSCDFCLELSRL